MLLKDRRSRQISFAVERFQETDSSFPVPFSDDGYVNEANDNEEEASDSANAADQIDEKAHADSDESQKRLSREVKLVDLYPNSTIEIKLSENLALA